MGLESITVRSTKGDLEEFKRSLIWLDIKRELIAWKKGFESELAGLVDTVARENTSTAALLTHLGSVDGRIKAVNYMLQLPDIFVQVLDAQRNEKEEPSPTTEEA